MTARAQLVLFTGSWLLVLLAIASVAVLVGGRMAEQTRRVGLLKAIGGTPRFVAARAALRVRARRPVRRRPGPAGRMARGAADRSTGAGLLGAPSAPSLTVSTVGLAVALALGVALVATFVPAIRAARQSTVAALEDSARAPRRRARVIATVGPPAGAAPARRAARRSPAGAAAAERLQRRASRRAASSPCSSSTGRWSGVLGPVVSQATTIISLMLVVLAAVNAVFIAWTTRAGGATPGRGGARPRSHAATGRRRPVCGAAAAGSARRAARHPRRDPVFTTLAKEAGATPVPPLPLACGDGRRDCCWSSPCSPRCRSSSTRVDPWPRCSSPRRTNRTPTG